MEMINHSVHSVIDFRVKTTKQLLHCLVVLLSPPHLPVLWPCLLPGVPGLCRVCRVDTIFSHTFLILKFKNKMGETGICTLHTLHTSKIVFPILQEDVRKSKKSRPHIYSKGAPPPETPGLQGARRRMSDRWYAPPAAYPLEHPRPLPVNPYSRRQAAVNQIISIPHGRKPVGQQTYLTYL